MTNKLKRMRWLLLFCLWTATSASAQPTPTAVLRVTAVNDSQFPLVTLNVLTIAPPGGPIADLTGLSLRENGIPVAYELGSAPVGVDVLFVVDANATMLEVDDDSGQTRWQKIQDTIGRFATEFMDPTGLDRVTVVLPDEVGANGRFLITNESDPTAVAAAVRAVEPVLVNPTPLDAMMRQAIEQAAGQVDDGRYQAILLLTDAGQIQAQLAFDALTQQAQAIQLPLFVAILGARADADELFRANRLSGPTLATTVHVPLPEAADPIYDIWAQQRRQLQLRYESLQRQSGQYPISLNLGEVRALTSLDLVLLPPEVAIAPFEPLIRRTGAAPDTPLAELQPQRQPLPLVITWPDGKPRRLLALTWTVNGWPQPAPQSLTPDADGRLLLDWDARSAAAGAYEVVVQVGDEFGLTAVSPPVTLTVVEERPLPPTPTPTPAPTPTPPPVISTIPGAKLASQPGLWLLLVVGLAAAGWLWQRQRRAQKANNAAALPDPDDAAADETPVADAKPLVAVLEPFLGDAGVDGPIPLTGSVSIGRDTTADLVLPDASVARLHARILQQGDEYWLYDEGSAVGTFHNYGRVGLAPQRLQDGDQIGLGRVQFRFRLRPGKIDDWS
ncbi:MAG: FHA domain-containing protein [Chloroflexi bacterium]|nr:FHA domain-containing protein [Chloroflexota bacterium]